MLLRLLERRIDRWARDTGLMAGAPASADELERANAHARERTAALVPGVCLVGVVLLAVWIGVDALLELDAPAAEAFHRLRLSVIVALASAGIVAAVFQPTVARFGRLYLSLLGTGVMCCIGWSLSLTPPDDPFIHNSGWLAFASLLVVVSLGRRVLVAAAFSGALWLGYVLPDTSHLAHPAHGIFVSTLGGLSLLAILFGQLLYLILLDLYVARERLDALKFGLEKRVAAATADLQALTERLDAVREEERRWMGHAVHDELGQELTAMRFALTLAQDQVRDGASSAPATLDDLEQLLDRTNATMRRIIRRLRPVVLDELGFVGALQWRGRDLAKRTGCEVRVVVPPEGLDLPAPVGEMLFRAVQESLTNVARHAGASAVEVTVRRDGERLVLTVDDDGVGLGDAPKTGGVGMVGIRERARAMGGEARWETSPLGGARMVVGVPARGGST